MSHSYVINLMHCTFSTKARYPFIDSELELRLWPYIGGIARENRMKALAIGGTLDHLHALLSLPGTMSLAVVIYVGKSVFDSINLNASRANWARTTRTARVVQDKDLNLRDGAGRRYRILMVIPRSSEVIVLSESQYVQNELWVKVRFASNEGWVHNSFLR